MGKKLNVLVYSGPGTTVESVRHCLFSLRRLLSPNYAVIPVTGDTIVQEPWAATCALLCIPGGADLGMCRTLNGEGNRKILQYVRRGGAYLGLCAGGYYGSGKVEFEVGNRELEVVGSRELKFFPGVCRGTAFAGFVYNSEAGAKACKLSVFKETFAPLTPPAELRVYYNGGGVFVNAAAYKDQKVDILASYADPLDVDAGEGNAAVISCQIGEGTAVLSGVHPEFSGFNLDKSAGGEEYSKLVDDLKADDSLRTEFFRCCLGKLGLNVNSGSDTIPSLSKLHLTSIIPAEVKRLVDSMQGIIVSENQGKSQLIVGENDTFVLEQSPGLQRQYSPSRLMDGDLEDGTALVDLNKIRKYVQLHNDTHPDPRDTPFFNLNNFYDSLKSARSQSSLSITKFGSYIMYGEVVTSTNTLMDKNFQFLQHLPHGFTAVGTVQIAGRGRGSNVWVSPIGSLAFSTVIKHNLQLSSKAPVIFIQYLAALAIVEAVKTYGPGYDDMPVRLKWPNDLYAEDPTKSGQSDEDADDRSKFVKIGGILVNSNFANNEYMLVVGCGVNATNAAPTTSLNLLVDALNTQREKKGQPKLAHFHMEKLLTKILITLEEMYDTFSWSGFQPFEKLYYSRWLHSDQIVWLEMEGGAKARIKGISMKDGLLQANELDGSDRDTGHRFTLQTDNNSFDFFKGLLKAKESM